MSLDYQILGLNSYASKEDIKVAYRRLALKYHPDLNNSRDANLKFIEINRAYNNLCNNMQNFEEASFEDLVKRRYYEKYVNNKSFEKSYGLDISFRTKVAWAVIFYIVLSVVFAIGGVYFLLILNQVL